MTDPATRSLEPYWPGLPSRTELAALVAGYTDEELAARLGEATPGTAWHDQLRGETARRQENRPLNDALAAGARRSAGCLEYEEDFTREWRATLRDPIGRAALTMAYQQAQAAGQDAGGQDCCGTLTEWHRPWCENEPHRYRHVEEPHDYLSPGFPDRHKAWTIQDMHRRGWSIEGLGRVFSLTPFGVELYLRKDTRA